MFIDKYNLVLKYLGQCVKRRRKEEEKNRKTDRPHSSVFMKHEKRQKTKKSLTSNSKVKMSTKSMKTNILTNVKTHVKFNSNMTN